MLFGEFVFQFIFGVPAFVLLNGVFIYGWHQDKRKNGTSVWIAMEDVITRLGPKDFFVIELDIFITICIVMLFIFVPQIDAIYGEVSSIFAFLGVPSVYIDPAILAAAAIFCLSLLVILTSLRDEEEWDVPLAFVSLAKLIPEDSNGSKTGETYKRSAKWKGRVAQIVGDTFQCLFLERTYLKAVRNSLFTNFRLATEMDDAGKFDDVCIKWESPAPVLGMVKNWILIQIKHRNTENDRNPTVTSKDLFHDEENKQHDFSVVKYVSSIIDIESNESMNGKKTYVLLTNSNLDSDAQRDWFIQADLSNELREIIPEHQGCCKLKKETLRDILKSVLDEKRIELAKAIKALFRNQLSNDDRAILKKYATVLHREVLIYRDKYKFSKKFLHKKAKRNGEEQKLWELLFEGDDPLDGNDTTTCVTPQAISNKASSKSLPLCCNDEQINLLVDNFIFAFKQPDKGGLKEEIKEQLKAHNPMFGDDAEMYSNNLFNILLDLILASLRDNPRFLTESQLLNLFTKEEIRFARAQHKSTMAFVKEMQACRFQFRKTGLEKSLLPNLILLKTSTEDGFLTKLKLFQTLQERPFFVFHTSELRNSVDFSMFWTSFDGSSPGVTFLVLHDTYREVLKSFTKSIIKNKIKFQLHNKKLIILTNTRENFEEIMDLDEIIEDFDSDHDECFLLVPGSSEHEPDEKIIFGNHSGVIQDIIKSLDDEESCVRLIEENLAPNKVDKIVIKFLLDNFPVRHWLSSYYDTLPQAGSNEWVSRSYPTQINVAYTLTFFIILTCFFTYMFFLSNTPLELILQALLEKYFQSPTANT